MGDIKGLLTIDRIRVSITAHCAEDSNGRGGYAIQRRTVELPVPQDGEFIAADAYLNRLASAVEAVPVEPPVAPQHTG